MTTPNVPTDRADGGAVLPSWLSTRAWPGGLLEIAELPERAVITGAGSRLHVVCGRDWFILDVED